MKKNIITSCPFPLIKLTVNIKYAAIQKPSGVGYIILVLIKDAKNREDTFSNVLLKQFGVPEDLQSIFADEVGVLLNHRILYTKQGISYQPGYPVLIEENEPRPLLFDEAKIEDFEFTENGERMFQEGFILTGEEKSKQITLYFNPLTSVFSFPPPSKSSPLGNSKSYSTDFMDQIKTDLSGIKDYILDNIEQTKLQKEERFLDCNIVDQEYLITEADKNLELLIDNEGMELSFKTAGAEAFYEKFFTPEMLEQELNAKSMFEFRGTVDSVEGFSEFKKLSAVYSPEEYTKQIGRPVKFLIKGEGENISVKRGNTTTSFKKDGLISSAASMIFSRWSFITIDVKEMHIYTAAKVNLTERVIAKPINVNLLVEQTFDAEQKQNVLKAIFGECKTAEFSSEYINLIKTISELDENEDYISLYIESKLEEKNNRSEQVEILLEANEVFTGSKWASIAEDYANKIYDGLLSELTKENTEYCVKMAKKLDNIRKPEKTALFTTVSNKLIKEISDEVELFNIMVNAGFNENESLSVANVINIYANKVLAGISELEKSPISDKFSLLAHNLNNLKANLGIQNTVRYAFRDEYNIGAFIEEFKAYKNNLLNLKKYEGFAPEGFKELNKYREIMQPKFDSIMAKRNASQTPDRINKKSVLQKADAGDYRLAVLEMAVYLEFILGKLLKIEKDQNIKLEVMIKNAKENKYLTDAQADTFNKLRHIRNQLVHSTEALPKLDKEKISQWANAVFSITEKAEGKK
jgi:hypothetical protein